LYPIEIIEETDQQVKIHYTGYSGHYDEWICKSQIGYKPVPLPRCLESLQSHNLSILACCIKQKLIPSRKMEDPKVRIQLAFDNNSVELLKQQAVLLTTQCHGHQSYGIKEYKDLNELLGEQWYLRVANVNGDFSYAILQTIQFRVFYPKPLLDFTPSLVSTLQGGIKLSFAPYYAQQPMVLSLNFVRMDGNRKDLVNLIS